MSSEYAVIVFFLLSGFLIAHSMEQNRRRNGRVKLVDFLAARFARIYPPFFFAVLVCIAVFVCLVRFDLPGYASDLKWPSDLYSARDRVTLPAREVMQALSLQSGLLTINGPLWSLYIEVKMYLLFGFGYCFFLERRRTNVLLALFVLTAYLSFRDSPDFVRYVGIWTTGCCAYYFRASRKQNADKHHSRVCLTALGSCVLVCLLAPLVFPQLVTGTGTVSAWLDFPIVVVMTVALFRRPFDLPLGRWLAPWSYSLYVVHFPVLLLVQALLIRWSNSSVSAIFWGSMAALFAAFAAGRLGGLIEDRKDAVQSMLVRSAEHILRRFNMALGKHEI